MKCISKGLEFSQCTFTRGKMLHVYQSSGEHISRRSDLFIFLDILLSLFNNIIWHKLLCFSAPLQCCLSAKD